MNSAALYQLKDRILIHPWQKTTMGLGIAAAPYVTLPLDAPPHALGNCVLAALGESSKEVPHPSSWKGQNEPLLKAAGVRSQKAFQSGARSLMVERDARALRIEPSRNGGTKGDSKGFEPLPALAISLAPASKAETIGAAIRAAFEKCT
jgi:hypothetical protein